MVRVSGVVALPRLQTSLDVLFFHDSQRPLLSAHGRRVPQSPIIAPWMINTSHRSEYVANFDELGLIGRGRCGREACYPLARLLTVFEVFLKTQRQCCPAIRRCGTPFPCALPVNTWLMPTLNRFILLLSVRR